MQILNTKDSAFKAQFEAILRRGAMDLEKVEPVVREILGEIKKEGDAAILRHIKKFDGWTPREFAGILITKKQVENAYNKLDSAAKTALKTAFSRIYAYHEKQKSNSWMTFEPNGTMLGAKITPISRAGLYIPGGKAAYPSSLLMNAVPAIVAGVGQIALATPTPRNEPNDLLLAAMQICEISEAYKVGGASAIGLFAFGTQSVQKTALITGPGNIFVACAKKMVFGEVGIDMVAGPSEIGAIADESADARLLAIDLLSQCEHDEMASAILITPSCALAARVKSEAQTLLASLKRREIATKSWENRGAIIVSRSLEEAVALMNDIAPEHLEILTANPHDLLPFIRNAGAIFLGAHTPEAIGDYIAGPNHTLPTGGSARFFSPLGVEHFVKKSSIISFSNAAINELGGLCATLAKCEGLDAHQKSVEFRLGGEKGEKCGKNGVAKGSAKPKKAVKNEK